MAFEMHTFLVVCTYYRLSGALDTANEAERLLVIQAIAENSIDILNHTKQVLQVLQSGSIIMSCIEIIID